jgi:hypothetical protein
VQRDDYCHQDRHGRDLPRNALQKTIESAHINRLPSPIRPARWLQRLRPASITSGVSDRRSRVSSLGDSAGAARKRAGRPSERSLCRQSDRAVGGLQTVEAIVRDGPAFRAERVSESTAAAVSRFVELMSRAGRRPGFRSWRGAGKRTAAIRDLQCDVVGAVITDSADDTRAAPPAVWPLFRVIRREQQSPNRHGNAASRPGGHLILVKRGDRVRRVGGMREPVAGMASHNSDSASSSVPSGRPCALLAGSVSRRSAVRGPTRRSRGAAAARPRALAGD